MNSEASSSIAPKRLPLPPPADSTQLAPGFRFHPTDEELVSYYLKRKITGRPLRVDAIAEVDLYRAEPWDLPPLSRLRSRDMEWYFFTSLDRKYSNRCRNNRATKDGYWKTTGKDRPIRRRSRIIGMKKTLVYHAGRAPRGKRTNWVMHEYRLEDEDLTRDGIRQDGFVVCRIFQKSGPGPQNGAQYGAPFVEEEWEREEEEDAKLIPVNTEGDDALMGPTCQNYVQLGDFLQDQDSGIQPNDAVTLDASSEQGLSNQTENSSTFIEEIFNEEESSDYMPSKAEFSDLWDNKASSTEFLENNGLMDRLSCASFQSNGYVQLNDIFDTESTCNVATVPPDQLHGFPSANNRLCRQPDDLATVPLENFSGQTIMDNLAFHDALSLELPKLEGVTDEIYVSHLAESDFLNDIIAYYDAIENSDYVPPDFLPQQFDLVLGSSSSASKEVHVESLTKHAILEPPPGDATSSGHHWNNTETSDDESKYYPKRTLTKHLASMLGSIAAPPAFADESSALVKTGVLSSSASANAPQLTAGVIQIQNFTAMGYTESWMMGKHAEMGFFLSYGVGDSLVCKSAVHEPREKTHIGFMAAVSRVGFHMFFISALLLALSYKVGLFVYNL
ncbi:hypothetical protein HPP92_014303 [Vanilla planifolia]|uniref:NAC domain-containing protein n=1 Tax=Vanilla planifolia TaxID=51239 RepID=A0A835QTL0_VANPL|nr:hypothetical protein HPP92_014303 [Vanilla planifolia]